MSSPQDPETQELSADLGEARASIAAIDPDPDALFGFRTIADRGDDIRLTVKVYGNLDRGTRQSSNPAKNGQPCRPAQLLTYMQSKGAGAFFVPSRLDGEGQLKQNVVAPRSLYVDADSRPETERLDRFVEDSGLAPTLIVASGGIHDGAAKLHAYWRVHDCPVAEFTKAQLTLGACLDSGPGRRGLNHGGWFKQSVRAW